MATSARPCWLWSIDGTGILWTNAAGTMLLANARASLATASLVPPPRLVSEIARLAALLSPDAPPRLHRVRGLGGELAPPLVCACSRITVGARTPALLIAAMAPIASGLSLDDRVRHLIDRIDAPLLAVSPDGRVLHANARAHTAGATWQAIPCTPALLAHAVDTRRASARIGEHEIAIDRLGVEADMALLVHVLTMPTTRGEPSALAESLLRHDQPSARHRAPAIVPSASQSTVRRHPLRFIWQMDEDGRFTIQSDELLRLLGQHTADLLGRPWREIAAELDLDPGQRVACAVATRDTWSGIALAWPVDDGSGKRLPIELAGLPMLDHNRSFRGYRGFGVCRDLAALDALAQRAAATTPPIPADPPTISPSRAPPPPPLPVTTSYPLVPTTDRMVPELSTHELRAFRELSLRLSERLTAPAAGLDRGSSGAGEAAEEHNAALVSAADARAIRDQGGEIRQLKAILDIAADGIVVLDHEGIIHSANKSAEALFGYDADEMAGRRLATLFAPGSAEEVERYLASLATGKAGPLLNTGVEVEGRVRQGGIVRLFLSLGRIGEDTDRRCAVVRDITPWKQTEVGLTEARRRAEQASAAKSDLLAKISHEVRTPLNAIIGFAQIMMEERLGPIGHARYREYAKDILVSGEHLLSVINDLLDLSKIEAGKLELELARVSLTDITQQCVSIMQGQASRQRVIVRMSLAPGLPPVIADARSLRQIILNLLSNAVKFTGTGGQVIVSTAHEDGEHAVLRVRDTGPGMSEAELAVALEPFGQLPAGSEASIKGTGLGLPLSKALAEANRAQFVIRSTPGEGTLVEIAFSSSLVG
ncbi:MAG: PAS domain S-box protein [Hyphomicrobiales bacterium]|nr:PAS domain S-box protein [Hyphomicrobiales bacterium]